MLTGANLSLKMEEEESFGHSQKEDATGEVHVKEQVGLVLES